MAIPKENFSLLFSFFLSQRQTLKYAFFRKKKNSVLYSENDIHHECSKVIGYNYVRMNETDTPRGIVVFGRG